MVDRRTRSKTKAMKNKEKLPRAEPVAKEILDTVASSQLVQGQVQNELASTHVLVEHVKTKPEYQTVPATGEVITKPAETLKTSIEVPEEELIDWEYEEEIEPSNYPQSAAVAEEEDGQKQPLDGETGSATSEIQDYTLEHQAKQTMIWSLESLLDYTPNLPGVLGLHNLGDVAMVQTTIQGVEYEVVWKIIRVDRDSATIVVGPSSAPEHDEEAVAVIEEPVAILQNTNIEDGQTSTPTEETSLASEKPIKTIQQPESHVHPTFVLPQPTPLSETRRHPTVLDADLPRCKYGKNCKNLNCPYDHEALCTFVNTKQGCTNGKQCPFSHRYEGKPCALSNSRYGCRNGFTCFFKHGDDFGVSVVNGQQVVKLPGINAMPSAPIKQEDTSTIGTAVAAHSDSGHTTAKEFAAGTKRPCEEDDGEPEHSATVQSHMKNLRQASTNSVVHPPPKRRNFGGPPLSHTRGHDRRGRGRGRGHGGRGGARGRGSSGFRDRGWGW